MRSIVLLSVVSVLAAAAVEAQSNATSTVTGSLGNANAVTNNPVGPVYTAVLPTTEFFNPSDPRGNVKGGISATAGPNGAGVSFTVNFSNLPTSGGPFPYHIHVMPISNGSCASALGHLDPFIRGEQPPCDSTQPQTCQVGDLSGKHGKITSDPFSATYVDYYTSLVAGTGAFFGNRSFVVHFGNTTRITCASFALVSGTAPSNATASVTVSVTPTAKPSVYTASAAGVTASLAAVFSALVAALLI